MDLGSGLSSFQAFNVHYVKTLEATSWEDIKGQRGGTHEVLEFRP